MPDGNKPDRGDRWFWPLPTLSGFWCKIVDGTPVLIEHEAARWLDLDHIDSVDWLPADLTIISLIKDKMIDQIATDILVKHQAAFEALAQKFLDSKRRNRRARHATFFT